MRGESGVAGEGRVVGEPKLHSWGKCTMSLTNINSDWIPNASSGLCIMLTQTLSNPNKNSLLDYLATKPKVKGFRDQGVVLPEVESFGVLSFWLLKKALLSERDIYQYQFINCE